MIILDYNDKRPIYEQIVDKMQRLIAGGALEPDEKLPSVRPLAVELSINPNTIQRAYQELERQGFIYSVKGKGSFVSENGPMREAKRKEIFADLKCLVEEARCVGIGMLAGAAVTVVGSQMMKTDKKHLKKSAGKAMKTVSDVLDNVQYMFK